MRVDVVDLVARTRRLLDDRVTIDLRDVEMSPVELSDDLLPEWYEDWVLLERERLRQICLHGLEALSRRLGSLGLHAQAVEAGLAAVGVEPLRESAQRALIEAHLAEGNASEAIRQFDRYAVLLEQELGIRPGESLRSLLPTVRGPSRSPAGRGWSAACPGLTREGHPYALVGGVVGAGGFGGEGEHARAWARRVKRRSPPRPRPPAVEGVKVLSTTSTSGGRSTSRHRYPVVGDSARESTASPAGASSASPRSPGGGGLNRRGLSSRSRSRARARSRTRTACSSSPCPGWSGPRSFAR